MCPIDHMKFVSMPKNYNQDQVSCAEAYRDNLSEVIFESVAEAPHVITVDLYGCSSS